MFLGALVDVGVPAQLLEETASCLHVGAKLEIYRVQRNGISATKVDVYANGEKDLPRRCGKNKWGTHTWAGRENRHNKRGHDEHAHSHAHQGEPVALLEHNYALQSQGLRGVGHRRPEHAEAANTGSTGPTSHHGHSHEKGRGLNEIRGIIGKAAISEGAKKTAIEIFEALGEAEAKIHDTDVEKIHFHEVGSVDALVDIVCAAVGAEALGVDEIVCSPLNVVAARSIARTELCRCRRRRRWSRQRLAWDFSGFKLNWSLQPGRRS